MVKHILRNAGLVVFGLAFVLTGISVRAQESSIKLAAKTQFELGQAAIKKKDFAQALNLFRKAFELDPNYAEAHANFKNASYQAGNAGMKDDLPDKDRAKQAQVNNDNTRKNLIAQYEEWSLKEPDNPMYHWMIGDLYQTTDGDKAEQHLVKAVSLKPKFPEAYQTLAMVYEVSGNEKKRIESLKKAADADPTDPNYAAYYAFSLRRPGGDFALYIKESLRVAERFPDHDRGAQALYWLGFETEDAKEKIAIYERLKTSFPPEKFRWSESGMSSLFEAYSESDPQKALTLAEEMAKLLKNEGDKKSWLEKAAYQRDLLQAGVLTDEKKYADAIALLEKVKLPKYMYDDALPLAKAKALDGSGQTDRAYQDLLTIISGEPSDALHAALKMYGAKLNKNEEQISRDVRGSLEAKAKALKDFSFTRYGDEKQVSLSDYRGKVVLLNFWYPFCGPCRGENPNLQKVLEKYGDRFVILAINVHPDEEKYVLPYIRGNKFGFIPLASDTEFAEKEFQARGFPTNILLDPEGRIVFKPRGIRGADEVRKLELQIEALLPRGD